MAEISDKLSIQLHINNRPQQITVPREKEKIFRDAAELINELYNQYRASFPHQSQEKYDTTVLIDLAARVMQLKDNNDTAPIIASIAQLTNEIEEVLDPQ